MRKIILLTFFISAALFSQSRFEADAPFISGLVGAAKVNLSGNSSSNPLSFAFGGSFGIPIIKNLYLYTRSSYSSQSNFQSFYNTSYINNSLQATNDFQEINSSFSQLLVNGGLLYNFLLSEEFVIGFNGGVSFMVINQEARLRTGTVISSIENENIWGAFGGVIVEKRWEESDFTTFFEAQYNYAKSDALYRTDALSAMNYTFGVRYYLAGR
ncbi:MAG: hypothetical protein KJN64_15310 [Ignavibacteria bacterium]|nr:hypothetical protein [Ignavibacteria bacterium]MBT8382655.1 hypothetical protein [Ignavibacteria bacterium]MBT8391230.1 hypothetical protein [Ignavibacteria bacterium]NNJ54423.1 hypothetical protein [Ignavibacteriaceae bacterium]NNL22457.1 hypothetical protein [Ignavibacteriaceae bacterium]